MEGRLFISEMMDTRILKVSQTWGLIKKIKKNNGLKEKNPFKQDQHWTLA